MRKIEYKHGTKNKSMFLLFPFHTGNFHRLPSICMSQLKYFEVKVTQVDNALMFFRSGKLPRFYHPDVATCVPRLLPEG